MNMINPLTRFSSRAATYCNRAPYPRWLLGYLRQSCGLPPDLTIADIGSGMGYLTGLLLIIAALVVNLIFLRKSEHNWVFMVAGKFLFPH